MMQSDFRNKFFFNFLEAQAQTVKANQIMQGGIKFWVGMVLPKIIDLAVIPKNSGLQKRGRSLAGADVYDCSMFGCHIVFLSEESFLVKNVQDEMSAET